MSDDAQPSCLDDRVRSGGPMDEQAPGRGRTVRGATSCRHQARRLHMLAFVLLALLGLLALVAPKAAPAQDAGRIVYRMPIDGVVDLGLAPQVARVLDCFMPPAMHNGADPTTRPCLATIMYKFKSKAAGDLIMTAPIGDQLLRIIGKEPAGQGIVEPAAMPAAIAALEAAIAMEQSRPRQGDAGPAPDPSDDASGDNVTLRQRAWPFVEMLKRAHAANAAIVWGV